MAKAPDKKAAAKGKKGKGDKKGSSASQETTTPPLSVATHPRAHTNVRRAKGFGGLVGFGLAAMLSLRASVPIVDVGERAMIGGIAGYLVSWGCAVTIWRQLMLAELRLAAERVKQRRAEAPK